MKKIFQILLFISAGVCFASCDDVNNNPDPSEAYDVAPEMKIYFDSFKKGSWWVLTSDITNRRDSIVVDSVERYLDQGIAERPTWWYKFNMKVFSTRAIFNNEVFNISYYTENEGVYTNIYPRDNIYLHFDLSYNSNTGKYWTTQYEVLPHDVNQLGALYHSVIIADGGFCTSCFNPELGKITFAPNIGFLKFESQTDTLALENYFIP